MLLWDQISHYFFTVRQIRIQNEAMKKQSMILLTEAAGDPKLMMALHEVEQLTQELETQKQKYQQEVVTQQGIEQLPSCCVMIAK